MLRPSLLRGFDPLQYVASNNCLGTSFDVGEEKIRERSHLHNEGGAESDFIAEKLVNEPAKEPADGFANKGRHVEQVEPKNKQSADTHQQGVIVS